MDYDFDTLVSRRGTDCVKWDLPAVDGVLPLWVADMDFRSAPAIVDALRRRVDEGVFGYAQPPASWHESLARWLARRHGWGIEPDSILDTTGVIPALAATSPGTRSSSSRPCTAVSMSSSLTKVVKSLRTGCSAFPCQTGWRVTSPTRWTLRILNGRRRIRG